MKNQFAIYYLEDLAKLGRTFAAIWAYFKRWWKHAKIEHDGKYWFYQTYKQIAEACGCSVSTVRRAVARLLQLGMIERKQIKKHLYLRTYHYRITCKVDLRCDRNENTEVSKVSTSNKYKKKSEKETRKAIAEVVRKCQQKSGSGVGFQSPKVDRPKPGQIAIEVKPGLKRVALDDGMWKG